MSQVPPSLSMTTVPSRSTPFAPLNVACQLPLYGLLCPMALNEASRLAVETATSKKEPAAQI